MSIEIMLLLAATFIAQDGSKQPTAEDVLEAAIKQRRAITRGTVTFRYVFEYPTGPVPIQKGTVQIWLDGDRLRTDFTYSLDPNHPAIRHTYCRNCQQDGHYVVYSEPQQKEEVDVRFDKIGDPNQKVALKVADFRALGMGVDAFALTLPHYRIDSELGRADRTKPTMEQGRWKDRNCWIVRYTWLTGPKAKVAIWIVPSMDHSVTRIELENLSNGRREKEVFEVDLTRYGKAGIWYPKTCTYVSHHDGKLFARDTTEVIEATLNEPVPAATFRLVGMKIPPGTRVIGSGVPNDGAYAWDGRDIIRISVWKGPERPTSVSTSDRTWLLVPGAALALSAGAAFWLFFSRRKAASASS